MHTIHRSLLVLGSALLTATSIAKSAGAQVNSDTPTESHIKTVSLIAGASQFDLAGTGTAGVLGARADMELNRWFVGEVGLTAMRVTDDFNYRITYILPEFQLQAQLPLTVVRPYVGLGSGLGRASAQGQGSKITGTIAGTGGVRVLLPRTSTTLRAEARVRGVGDNFSGSMVEYTLGVGQRF